MSQTSPPRKPAYPRTFPGLIGAMLIVVLAVFAFVAFRGLLRDNPDAPPVRAVEWTPWFEAARQEGRIVVLQPEALPEGWIAREARYNAGALHLAMLTEAKKYVGLEAADKSLESLVEQYVDEEATPGKAVTISGESWQTWTDRGGDYAVGRTIGTGATATSYLVVGSAPAADIRTFAASLRPAAAG